MRSTSRKIGSSSWKTVTSVGPAAAPVTPRPAATRLLIDRWREASGTPVGSYDAGSYDAGGDDAGEPPSAQLASGARRRSS